MLGLLHNAAQASGYDYSYSVDSATAAGVGAFFVVYMLFVLAVVVVTYIGMWKVFVKAGKPGWAAIVPIYNIIVLLEIVGRPMWWILLYFVAIIPFVGWAVAFVAAIIVINDLAKSFGKDVGFTVLLLLLPFVGFPMLGFGKDKYRGPAALAGGGHPGAHPGGHPGGPAPHNPAS